MLLTNISIEVEDVAQSNGITPVVRNAGPRSHTDLSVPSRRKCRKTRAGSGTSAQMPSALYIRVEKYEDVIGNKKLGELSVFRPRGGCVKGCSTERDATVLHRGTRNRRFFYCSMHWCKRWIRCNLESFDVLV